MRGRKVQRAHKKIAARSGKSRAKKIASRLLVIKKDIFRPDWLRVIIFFALIFVNNLIVWTTTYSYDPSIQKIVISLNIFSQLIKGNLAADITGGLIFAVIGTLNMIYRYAIASLIAYACERLFRRMKK